MISYHRVDVELAPIEHLPPFFLGSALRGAFGHALKQIACSNTERDCTKCVDCGQCVYYLFYEEKNISHPYRFSKGLGEDNYDFSLYLFEKACEYLPVIDQSLRYMLEVQGLHTHRETFTIKSLTCNDKEMNEVILTQTFLPEHINPDAKVNFVTPLRIKHKGHLLTRKPTLEILLDSVYYRLSELKNFPMTRTSSKPSYITGKSHLQFQDLSRFSNRQDDGFV